MPTSENLRRIGWSVWVGGPVGAVPLWLLGAWQIPRYRSRARRTYGRYTASVSA